MQARLSGRGRCCPSRTPFSSTSALQKLNFFSKCQCPPFYIIQKFCYFQAKFSLVLFKISLTKICSQDPSFFRKIRSVDPTFENSRGTYYQKRRLPLSDPGGSCMTVHQCCQRSVCILRYWCFTKMFVRTVSWNATCEEFTANWS